MCCIRKDLLKTKHFPGLMLCTASNITARIPLQSAARTSHADSFSPGEAIGAAAPLSKVNNNFPAHCKTPHIPLYYQQRKAGLF